MISDSEIDRINAKLDKVLSPNFGKGKIRDMIADGLELRRLGEELESGVSGDERAELESAFDTLADKIRDETKALINKNRMEQSAVEGDGETDFLAADRAPNTEGRSHVEPVYRPADGRPAVVIHGAGVGRKLGVRVSLRSEAPADEVARDSDHGRNFRGR